MQRDGDRTGSGQSTANQEEAGAATAEFIISIHLLCIYYFYAF